MRHNFHIKGLSSSKFCQQGWAISTTTLSRSTCCESQMQTVRTPPSWRSLVDRDLLSSNSTSKWVICYETTSENLIFFCIKASVSQNVEMLDNVIYSVTYSCIICSTVQYFRQVNFTPNRMNDVGKRVNVMYLLLQFLQDHRTFWRNQINLVKNNNILHGTTEQVRSQHLKEIQYENIKNRKQRKAICLQIILDHIQILIYTKLLKHL